MLSKKEDVYLALCSVELPKAFFACLREKRTPWLQHKYFD
jgi:hypothetical protein